MSHALPKQQTLLDCFLEAQAKRTRRRRSSADGTIKADQAANKAAPADDGEQPAPTGLNPFQVT